MNLAASLVPPSPLGAPSSDAGGASFNANFRVFVAKPPVERRKVRTLALTTPKSAEAADLGAGLPLAASPTEGCRASVRLNPRAVDASLWQGAWVGWLTCQAVLLLLVESTPLGQLPALANFTRVLVSALFVGAFSRPCFVSPLHAASFTSSVFTAEWVIACASGRLSDARLLPAALALGLFQLWFAPAGRLRLFETAYPVFAWASRLTFGRLAPTSNGAERIQQRLYCVVFQALESSRRSCAAAINRQRCE